MYRHTTSSRPARLLPGVALLVLALLWSQLLGLAHGVLHTGAAGHEPAAVVVQQLPAASGLLGHLLAPSDDDSKCRLYDQLGHGVPLLQLPVLPAAALPQLPMWVALPSLRPQPCAVFAARAPPTFR